VISRLAQLVQADSAAAPRSRLARVPQAGIGAGVLAIACLALAVPAARPLAASPFAVHVSLTPQVIGRDETATLTIEAEGGGLGGFRFEPSFLLENLTAVSGPSRYEDFTIVNGSLSHTSRYTLQLRPLATGPGRVRVLVLQVRGQRVRLPDQEIRVQEQPTGQSTGGAGVGAGVPNQPSDPEDVLDQLFGRGSPLAPPQVSQSPAAFLRAELQPPRPLAGEQAIYTIYLYSRQNVAAIASTAMPSFQGFWVRDLPPPEHTHPEMIIIGGERYGRVPMFRKALFALRPGRHMLEPAACDVVVESPMRSFFGSPIPRSEELHLRTPEVAVEVQPLPPAPSGFGGLVGQVSLAAKLQPYSVRLGDGVTLTVTLAGAGHLQGVAAPRLDLPPGLTVFPPQQQSEDHVNGAIVEGRRTWTYVIVPNQPGQYRVRPQPISYFDPEHQGYRLAESPALALTALPAPAAAPPSGALGAAAAGAGRGTAAQHPKGGTGLRDRGPLARLSPLPGWPGLLVWLAMLAAGGIAVAVILARRRDSVPQFVPASADAGEAPPPRPREVEQKLREAAREDRPRHAAALVEEGWRRYLAGRWGLPATTPPARWGAVLAAQGLTSEIADEVTRLVEELHYLRYAPQLSTTGAVRDQLLTRSRQLLRRLR
jgi:hypothetical protein